MSELTDRLKEAQGAGGSAPKLNVAYFFDMGPNKSGVPSFKWYNKDAKENQFLNKPITGIFIGHALQMEAFDKNYGSKGGTWSTGYYFQNSDEITLFEPRSGDKSKKKTSGNAEVIKAAFGAMGLTKKTKYCIYILTDNGLVCVRTNCSIAIGDINPLQKDIFQKMVVLMPKLYDAEDKTIAAKTHKSVGPLAATNRPTYAKIILGEDINEEKAISWGIFNVINEFKVWREYKQKTGKVTEGEQQVEDKSISSPDLPDYSAPTQTVAQNYQSVNPNIVNENDVNDLPF